MPRRMRSRNSSQDRTRMCLRNVRAILPNRLSTMFSQVLQQGDEFTTAMTALDARRHVAVVQIQGRQDRTGSQTFVFVVAGDLRMFAGNRPQVWRGVRDGL